MKTDLFQCCGHCWVFQICWHIECSTFIASSFRIWNSSTGIPSLPVALFVVMLPKDHLTSHSRMSGSRWVITPSWLSGSWRSFLYSSSVYSCHLFLISSASVRFYHFCPLLSPSLHDMFPWCLSFSWRDLCVPCLVTHLCPTLWPHGQRSLAGYSPWGFSRPGWNGFPCPPPGDLPNPGIEPRSPASQVDSLPSEPSGKPEAVPREGLLVWANAQLPLISRTGFLLVLPVAWSQIAWVSQGQPGLLGY